MTNGTNDLQQTLKYFASEIKRLSYDSFRFRSVMSIMKEAADGRFDPAEGEQCVPVSEFAKAIVSAFGKEAEE